MCIYLVMWKFREYLRWWRVIELFNNLNILPILICSSILTGTGNSVFATRFQSALGILVPVDWFDASSNLLLCIRLYKKLLCTFSDLNTQKSPTAFPEKSGNSQFFRYGLNFPYKTSPFLNNIPFLLLNFLVISLFSLPSPEIISSYSTWGISESSLVHDTRSTTSPSLRCSQVCVCK